MTWTSGNRYTGSWLDNLRTGHGEFTWGANQELLETSPEGPSTPNDKYIGMYLKGKKHGYGKFEYVRYI